MSDHVLRLESVTKSFGQVEVIKGVDLTVRRGQVQALLGENGAGKSTLIKMIAGVHQPDSGRIVVDGAEVKIPDTKASEALGIATIHQELNLVPTMSVAENIMLGRTPRRFGLVNHKHLKAQAQAALHLIGLDVDLDMPVGELGVAKQQLVEIAKALSMNARILILDEPTAALTGKEVDALFAVLEELKAKGVAMIFISHHLEELARIAETISVLRDGSFIAEVPADTDEDELVRLMVGREIENQYPRKVPPEHGEALLEVSELTSDGAFHDVTFSVHAGEVVGLAGLVGAGRTEVIRAIAGANPYDSGSIRVGGTQLRSGDIRAAIRAGVGHIPEDRKSQALVLDASVGDNLGFATLYPTAKAGLADRSGQHRRAGAVAEKLRIRMADLSRSPSGTYPVATNKRLSSAAGCSPAPKSSCSMSPPAASTSAPRWRFTTLLMRSPQPVAPCSWPPPIYPRCSACPIASSSCPVANSPANSPRTPPKTRSWPSPYPM